MNARYLRQRLVARLSAIQLGLGKYKEASRSIEKLMIEVKKLDDKQLLVELHLIESKINHKVRCDAAGVAGFFFFLLLNINIRCTRA